MTSLPTTPGSSNTASPAAAPRTNAETFRLIQIGLAIAAVIGGLILTVMNGMAWGYLLVGLLLGLLFWKPIHGVLVAYSIFSVYPAIRIISVSLRPTNGLLSRSLDIIPAGASLENYLSLFRDEPFLLWLWNSLAVTISVAVFGVAVAATSAYAFSRWRFPGRRPMLIFLLMTQMIPAGMLVIPIFVIVAQLGLRDQVVGLMLAYIVTAVPFSVWILKGYYDTIPPDLEEAAMVDGCNRLEAFFRMILPLSTPALSIVFLFNFLGSWSEFIVANQILQSESAYTWPLGLNSFIGSFNTDWGKYAAAAALVTIPVVLLFISQARYLISGLTLGSVKS
jgi:arabinogalactan oligomer / maltooligosaccharide transport system permease protein